MATEKSTNITEFAKEHHLAPDFINQLRILFEGLRAFTLALPAMSADDAHIPLFLGMVCDRGDELLGLKEIFDREPGEEVARG